MLIQKPVSQWNHPVIKPLITGFVSPDQQDVEAAGQWVVAMRQTLDQSVKEMQQIGTRPFGEEWDRLHETGRSLLDCFPLNLSYRLIPADDGEES